MSEPQNADLRDVAVPDVVGPLGLQQIGRFNPGGFLHRGFGLYGRLGGFGFAQHTLHAGTTDLNVRSQQVPGHGARSEFRFRAEPSQFLRRPAYGVIHAIPDDGPGQQDRLAVALDGFDPGEKRIFVNHEPYSTRAIA